MKAHNPTTSKRLSGLFTQLRNCAGKSQALPYRSIRNHVPAAKVTNESLLKQLKSNQQKKRAQDGGNSNSFSECAQKTHESNSQPEPKFPVEDKENQPATQYTSLNGTHKGIEVAQLQRQVKSKTHSLMFNPLSRHSTVYEAAAQQKTVCPTDMTWMMREIALNDDVSEAPLLPMQQSVPSEFSGGGPQSIQKVQQNQQILTLFANESDINNVTSHSFISQALTNIATTETRLMLPPEVFAFQCTTRVQSPELQEPTKNSLPHSMISPLKAHFTDNRQAHLRWKCQCTQSLAPEESCQNARRWLATRFAQGEEITHLKRRYRQLAQAVAKEAQVQIDKDLDRTFYREQFLRVDGKERQLREVLRKFAVYEQEIGYVQGLNFIAGTLLYHADEYVTFWLLILLCDKLGLRKLLCNGFPDLRKHLKILEILFASHLPELHKHFVKLNFKNYRLFIYKQLNQLLISL